MYSFGSDEYIQRIVEVHSRTLLRVAYNIVRSREESEDIVQDVLLSLITRGTAFDSEDHEKAWLIRATINKARNVLKKNARLVSGEQCADISSRPAVSESGGEVLSTVLSLPEKYRIPVHLYYYEGYSTKEISEILRLPQPTVCTRLSRARAMLRDMLG